MRVVKQCSCENMMNDQWLETHLSCLRWTTQLNWHSYTCQIEIAMCVFSPSSKSGGFPIKLSVALNPTYEKHGLQCLVDVLVTLDIKPLFTLSLQTNNESWAKSDRWLQFVLAWLLWCCGAWHCSRDRRHKEAREAQGHYRKNQNDVVRVDRSRESSVCWTRSEIM